MSWFTFGDALGAANLGLGIIGAFNGGNRKAAREAQRAQQAMLAEQQRVTRILEDANNEGPMFQQQYADRRAVVDRDFAQNLRQIRTTNARANARGTGWINPERQDEAMASALLRNQLDLRNQAREQARRALLASAGIASQNAQNYASAGQLGIGAAQLNQRALNQQLGGVAAGLQALNWLGGANRGGWSSMPVSNLWNSGQPTVSMPRGNPAQNWRGMGGPSGMYAGGW